MENENTISAKLNRIDAAFDRIRIKTDMANDAIEDVAAAVEGLKDPSGTLNITTNDTYDVVDYANVEVNVPGLVPTGNINITANADDIDVSEYATASVQVPQPSGTVNIISNGTYNVFNYANANVSVMDIEAAEKDINFYDYDGFRVASWTLSELSSKTSLPVINRSHNGLVFQNWNWSLANLKTVNRKTTVGALYRTSDNKTKLYIDIPRNSSSLSLSLSLSKDSTCTVEWGDGTSSTLTNTSTLLPATKTASHTYSKGLYTISLSTTGSSLSFIGSSNSKNCFGDLTASNYYMFNFLYRIECSGTFDTGFASGAFNRCYNLRTVVTSSECTSFMTYAFYDCEGLKNIIVPNGTTKINSYCFSSCSALEMVSLPYTITSLDIESFRKNYVLRKFHYPHQATTVPNYALGSCNCVKALELGSSVSAINTYGLSYLYGVDTLTIPSTVTSIGACAFYNCYSLKELHFKATTPPTVDNINAFTGIPTTCRIYVPSSKLSTYKSATNYPSSSTYTYVGE